MQPNKEHIFYNPLVRTTLVTLFVCTSLFLLAGVVQAIQGPQNPNQAPAQISVSGDGKAFAIPDTAFITFDVSKEAKDVATAQKQVNDIVTPVVEGLKAKGIDAKDIKTLNYNANPVYDYRATPPCYTSPCPPIQNQTLRGFQVSESIQVKVRKTDMAGEVLTYLGTQGVTNLNGPTYTVDDEDAVKAEARAEAIDAAQAKAEVLAKQLGVRLGKILSFNEGSNYPYAMRDQAMMGSAKVENAPTSATVPVGQNTYTSSVTITYELR